MQLTKYSRYYQDITSSYINNITVICVLADNGDDIDSGRGPSPSRTASAVVHNGGQVNAAYNKDDDEEEEDEEVRQLQ